MKARHFLLGATLLSAGLLFNAPLFAAVESDIVGYTTIQMDAGKWYQVGNPFVELDTNGASTKLNELLADGFSDGDTVSIYLTNEDRYEMFSWRSAGAAGPGWYLGRSSSLTDAEVPVGQAMFIHKGTGSNEVVFSGKVSETEVVEFGSTEGESWNQVVCVYPQTKKLNDFAWAGLADKDTVSVYLPEEDRYEMYTWRNAGTEDAGWYLGRSSVPTDTEIQVGQALFINKHSKGIGQLSVK